MTLSYVMQAGSYNDPLLADFIPPFSDPAQDWQIAYQMAGARAQRLLYDFPLAYAMIRAKLMGTHGAKGLRHRSVFQRDDNLETDEQEESARVQIDAIIRDSAKYVDANGVLSRAEFEWEMDKDATIYGDAFAIRVLQPGRGRYATAWRMIHPWRVCNPPGYSNGKEWKDGGKFKDGRLVAIGYSTQDSIFGGVHVGPVGHHVVPVESEDGVPNVVHRRGLTMTNHWRGLTLFAPIILESRLLQGLGVAYVASKRVQASHPLMIKTEDVQKAREQYKGTRMANLIMGLDDEVIFSNYKFEGQDYEAFYNTNLRNLCAPWGIPYELVIGDHSAKSGASARSTWQAYWMHSEQYQEQHISQVTEKIDRSYLAEAMIVDDIDFGTDDLDRIMLGKYIRPPRLMPDPLKEAQAVTEWRNNNVSLTTLQGLAGFDFDEEQRLKHQESVIMDAQETEEQGENAENEPNDSGDVVEEVQEETPEQPQAVASTPDIHVHVPPTQQHFSVSMPQQEAPVVNVTNEAPAPVVNVSADQPAPIVNVQVEAAQVDVPAPVVNVSNDVAVPSVNVEAPVVNVANEIEAPTVNVEVPQRRMIAKPGPNGSVEMIPQE